MMDGCLLGSQQASWMSRTMVATAAACGLALAGAQFWGLGIMAVWLIIKCLTIGRCIGNAWRLASPESPLGQMGRPPPPPAAAAAPA